MFAGTVIDNIRYGKPNASQTEIIEAAKRILVLTEQGIEEQGTHDELLALGGSYARLYNKLRNGVTKMP